jgi:DNA-binding transcriptional LysR family regulator
MDADRETFRLFVAVAESASFTKAAAAAGVARPRLSARMVELEDWAGEPLFDREAGGTALTDAGRRLLELARSELARPVEERDPLLSGGAAAAEEPRVRITIMPGATIGKWTTRFEERNPRENLSVTPVDEHDQLARLRAGEADVAFVRLPIGEAGDVHVIPLYSEATVVVAPKGHLVEAADTVVAADLAGERLLTDPGSLPDWNEATDPVPAEQRAELAGLTPDQLVEVVASGVGVAVLPQSVARAAQRRDVVARVITDAPETTVAIAWLRDDESEWTEQFVGIVRGRSERSSRAPAAAAAPQRKPPAQAQKQQKQQKQQKSRGASKRKGR